MSTVISPRSIVRAPSISCFLPVDNRLLIATIGGEIIIYSTTDDDSNSTFVNDPLDSPVTLTSLNNSHPTSPILSAVSPSNNPGDPSLQNWLDSTGHQLTAVTKFQISSKPITEMKYLKDLNYLILKYDNCLHLYNFSTFKLVKTLVNSKGLTSYAVFSQMYESELGEIYNHQRTKESNNNPPKDKDIQSKLHKLDSYSLYQNFYDHDPFEESSMSTASFTTTAYAPDDMIHSYLAYSVKRRLYIISWDINDSNSFKEVSIALPDKVRNFEFLNSTKILVGLTSDFDIVDIPTGTLIHLPLPAISINASYSSSFLSSFSGGPRHNLSLVKLIHNLTLLVAHDRTSIKLHNATLEPLNKSYLTFTSTPISIHYLFPYIVLVTTTAIEIRDPKNGYLLQSISIGHSQSPISIIVDPIQNFLYLQSGSTLMQCQPKSFISQLNSLEASHRLDEAANLAFQLPETFLPDKTSRLRQLQIKKAARLFSLTVAMRLPLDKKLSEAMELFSSFLAPPELVLSLFPRFVTGHTEYLRRTEFDGFVDTSLSNITFDDLMLADDNNVLGREVSNSDIVTVQGSRPSTPTPFAPSTPKQGMTRSSSVMNITGDSKSIYSVGTATTSTPNRMHHHHHRHHFNKEQVRIKQNRKKLMKAIHALVGYLADTRRKIGKMLQYAGELNNDSGSSKPLLYWKTQPLPLDIFGADLNKVATLVDDTLFCCYLMISPLLIGPLFRVNNWCSVEIVEERLMCHRKSIMEDNNLFDGSFDDSGLIAGREDESIIRGKFYTELIDFYHGKKLHGKALELLKRLGNDEEITIESLNPDDETDDEMRSRSSDTSTPESIPSLLLTPATVHLSNSVEALEALRSPLSTIHYLLKLNQDYLRLIFQYIRWPMLVMPDKAMLVFLADSEENELLNRESVVDFLMAGLDFDDESMRLKYVIDYLEHVIGDFNDSNPKLHTKYVELLLELSLEENCDLSTSAYYDKLVAFVSTTNNYEPRTCLRLLQTRVSQGIDADVSRFIYLQTFIYRRLGDHLQVLQLLVWSLHDHARASEYCSELFKQDGERVGKHWLYELLKMYLKSDGKAALDTETDDDMVYGVLRSNLQHALELLETHRYATRLQLSQILGLFPGEVPISMIASMFAKHTTMQSLTLAKSRTMQALAKVELIKHQHNLLSMRSKLVVVDSTTRCGWCGKGLGGSVIGIVPNFHKSVSSGMVIHYGCIVDFETHCKKQVTGGGGGGVTGMKVIKFGDR